MAVGQGVTQGRRKQSGAAKSGGQFTITTAFPPQALREGEAVGAFGGIVDGVGNINPAFDRDAIEATTASSELSGNLRVGVGFVPQGAGENGRAVLVACEAQISVGVVDLRLTAGPVVFDQLEFETTGGFVVADHLQHSRFFLIAEVEAVLEVGGKI